MDERRAAPTPMSRKFVGVLALILVAAMTVAADIAHAEPVAYVFSGTIDRVDDRNHLLKGAVVAGSTTFTVTVVFDSDSTDLNPAESIAQYRSTGAPFGFTASVG